jgi:hypothetical protein
MQVDRYPVPAEIVGVLRYLDQKCSAFQLRPDGHIAILKAGRFGPIACVTQAANDPIIPL